MAERAFAEGLAVTRPSGERIPIPVTATPVLLSSQELKSRSLLSHTLAGAAVKVANILLQGDHRHLFLDALSPLERRFALITRASILPVARVDYFVDASIPHALELNATIPAMQGYSDIAMESLVASVGAARGLGAQEITGIQAMTPSNARALFEALQQATIQKSGHAPKRIFHLLRPLDAQITEQQFLARRFSSWGIESRVIVPEDLVKIRLTGEDLIYRHIFVRRLEESIPGRDDAIGLLDDAVRGAKHGTPTVLNLPASPYEEKILFSFLSQILHMSDLARDTALSDEELNAIEVSVPWTRHFRSGRSTLGSGERIANLLDEVAQDPERYVLKRSWDYGGRAVFVGSTRDDPSFKERVLTAYGEVLDWAALCKRCAEDLTGGGYVVQQRIENTQDPHILCDHDGAHEIALHVDFSSYASVGLEADIAWGGVCRGSTSSIVNIVGGGGVVPLLTEEASRALFDKPSQATPAK